MFKSYFLFVLTIVAGLSSTAYLASTMAASTIEASKDDRVSNAYGRLIQAEHQLLKSELAVEAKKSASFNSLLANGHASWLENRQQKLVVDILNAKLTAYEQFKSQAQTMLTDGEIKSDSMEKGLVEMRQTTMQDLQKQLTSLRQAEEKLAHAVVTLAANDPWLEGYRLRHAVAGRQVDVVAAKIMLLERLNASPEETAAASVNDSTTDRASTFTAAWKQPSKASSFMQLLITQAELQIKLSQHHLTTETQRLASLQELVGRGMATQRSLVESNEKVEAVTELLNEQQDNLSWLKKDLDASPETANYYTSVSAKRASGENAIAKKSPVALKNSSVLPTLLNSFKLGQANYLRREAILKGDMYREVLSHLERAVVTQIEQPKFDGTSAKFSNVLILGQQRELEQYRRKIEKTELQRDLADAQIALLNESDGSLSDNLHMLVSVGIGSNPPVTLPSRFLSSDPFGLQTTYSAFVYHSPRFEARRPALATRGDYSAVFKPIINRDALSYYRGLQSSAFRSSYGGFNRVHSYGYLNPGYRRPGQPPWYFPGSPSTFGASRFSGSSHFNSFGRGSQFNRSIGRGFNGY